MPDYEKLINAAQEKNISVFKKEFGDVMKNKVADVVDSTKEDLKKVHFNFTDKVGNEGEDVE